MSVPLDQGYVGLSEVPEMEGSDKFSASTSGGLNFKATELRLGLPGSESPERDEGVEDKNVHPLSMVESLVSRTKRVFSDTIDGGFGKWLLSGNGGLEVGLGKDAGLFSPRGVGVSAAKTECTNQQTSLVKDKVPQSPKTLNEKKPHISAPAAKEQVVGWPPIRSFRRNSMTNQPQKEDDDDDAEAMSGCLYVKVSMDGAPYLRKVDLKNFGTYTELSAALENMFTSFTISTGQWGCHGLCGRDNLSESILMDLLHGSEYVLTYEDKDGDWMLVGDVPWEMFTDSCKRLRIMKSSDAIGLAPRAMEKCKSRD